MAIKLFEGSYHTLRDQLIRAALDRVSSMPDDVLLAHTLSSVLDKIADDARFDVAVLHPEGRRGTRRKEFRKRRDYGQVIDVEVTLIDVRIPFSGDPGSFQIAPSHSHVIDRPVTVNSDHVILSLQDDDGLEREVNDFLSRVGENLDCLRQESAGLRNQARSQIGAFAEQRVAEAKARRERDQKRSFPID